MRTNLVLARREQESVMIGDIKVTVVSIRGNHVRLAIEADRSVSIVRTELAKGPNLLGPNLYGDVSNEKGD